MNPEFWQNKRVFITGHTGFKGSWLSLWLNKLGAQVHGYALPPSTEPNLFDLADIGSLVVSTLNDTRDRAALAAALSDAQPDIIFHLAAQPLVKLSYLDPLSTLETNIMGAANLLEGVRQCPSVKAVVVITSDKCYVNREWQWGYRENEALGGHDPYSASKACVELLAQSWQQSYFNSESSTCAVATARAGNVIGGGDWSKDRLIPDVLASINNNEPVVLRSPDAVRPWQHVLEPLAGYLLLAEKLMAHGKPWAEGWNFGPQDSDNMSVKWVVERLLEHGGQQSGWVLESEQQPHEAQLLKLDSSKARQVLGWKNAWTLDACIKEIAVWNRHWQDGSDMQKISDATIDRYVAAMEQ